MPWDLIFYGSMAIIFIGIIAASSRARRERKAQGSSVGGTSRDTDSLPDGGGSGGSAGGDT